MFLSPAARAASRLATSAGPMPGADASSALYDSTKPSDESESKKSTTPVMPAHSRATCGAEVGKRAQRGCGVVRGSGALGLGRQCGTSARQPPGRRAAAAAEPSSPAGSRSSAPCRAWPARQSRRAAPPRQRARAPARRHWPGAGCRRARPCNAQHTPPTAPPPACWAQAGAGRAKVCESSGGRAVST